MKIEIADIRLNFEFKNLNLKLKSKLQKTYRNFFSKKSLNTLNIFTEFHQFKKTNTGRPQLIVENNKISAYRDDFIFECKNSNAYLKIMPSIYSFDSFLRILLSGLLPPKRAVLVHASSFIYNDKVYVFVGKSGSGKTTISQLAKRNAFIMSDELTPVFENSYAFSSPFWGRMNGKGENISDKIQKMYIIKKSITNRTEEISFDEFIFSFMPCIMNFNKSSENISLIIDIANSIYKNIKVEKLFFSKKDNSFLKVI